MPIYRSPYPDIPIRPVSITERVLQGLQTRLDEPVLVDGPSGRRMLGRDFISAVKALAGGFRTRGFGNGSVVAVMAPNVPEFCVIFHAVAWAGGTITTINPTYTAQEARHQLQDAQAKLLITVPPCAATAQEAAGGTDVTEIAVIGEAEGITPLSALMGEPLAGQVTVDLDRHTLVLPYSSGTTGLPKGVMLSHRNLVANVEQIQAVRPVEEGEWTVGFLPFFHIYGMTVLMNLYLAAGGGVVTLPRFDLELFLRLCQDYRTRQAYCVPPVVLALAKHPAVDEFDLSAMQSIFSGAAPLGIPLSEAASSRLGVSTEQGYGMTEMSPASHISPHGQGKPGAAGVMVPNTECRIVDPETGKDCPAGAEGELWVRGPQVMMGYLNNPEATAACLDAEGWLRTGDIASIDEGGYLFISDRLKELIKVKGFQVAPAEVEAALVAHPGIADAAVIGVPDDESGEVPMAFLVSALDTPPSLEEVQTHLARELAPYKQIRRVEFVAEVPKSASGKILRRVLRARIEG